MDRYLRAFRQYETAITDLLDCSVNLRELRRSAIDILSDTRLLETFRYIAGPPISTDDLKTLAEATSLHPRLLRNDAELVARVVEIVHLSLDRRRFPWIAEHRDPTEQERHAAVIASAALMATRRLETARRNEGKTAQENAVEEALSRAGLVIVEPRTVRTVADAPVAGEFCRESKLGRRKADFVLRLWDHRLFPIECKVSNSALNSIKRLNNDAAAKAEEWRRDFGATQVVPTAVLSGVYKLPHLENAQARGLVLFWAHDLGAMIDWIEATRQHDPNMPACRRVPK